MSIYNIIRRKKDARSGVKFQKFKRDHSMSFASTGRKCACGHDHDSINILDENMMVIEEGVCPFMYGVRNACLRARYGERIEKIDIGLLAEVSRNGH